MTPVVEIEDDPAHPEGGHALVLFRGVDGSPGPARLVIEPLTDGYVYRGPRQIDAFAKPTAEGLLLSVGGRQFDQLDTGVAVSLAVPDIGIEVDVLWPALTPMAAPRRSSKPAPAKRRPVVEADAPPPRMPGPVLDLSGGVAPPGEETPVLPIPTPELVRPVLAKPVPATPAEPAHADPAPQAAPVRGGGIGGTPAGHDPRPDVALAPAIPRSAPRPGTGRRWPVVAAAAVLGFGAGAAVVGALWMTRPAPQTYGAPAAEAGLPSVYATLHDLSDRSPRGTRVEMRDWPDFLARSRAAGSTPEESSFWRRWATRALLEAKADGVASTLSDFATDLARSHADQPTIAAARVLWEMAAVADDCAAMENIAAAMRLDGDKAVSDQAATWRTRATRCKDRSKGER